MSNRIEKIRLLLTQHLNPSQLDIQDDSDAHRAHYTPIDSEPSHLTITIASTEFRGLSKVQCHKKVYQLLDPFFKEGLHALSLNISAD